MVPPKDLRKKAKIWRLLKSLHRTRDASQVFATYVEEGLNDHGFQRNAVVPCLYWGAVLQALGVHWGDDFIFGIPDDRADDLEQLMREVFKVKICERIGPGFLTSVEFRHRKVGWNAEGFSWTHDSKHTHWQWLTGLVSTERSNSSKRSGKSLWHLGRKRKEKVCATVPTVLMNKKHNMTDHWLAQHCTLDKTDQKHTMQRKEAARFMSDPTRAARCMLKRGTRAQLEFSISRKCQVRSGQ